jgi:hypothetical protein
MGALAVVAGCDHQEQSKEAVQPPLPSAAVMKQSNAATASSKDSLLQTKDEAVAAVEKQLHDADLRIQALAEKSMRYVDAGKTEAESALAILRTQREVAASKLAELKAANLESWRSLKASFDLAFGELEKSFETLKAKFPG